MNLKYFSNRFHSKPETLKYFKIVAIALIFIKIIYWVLSLPANDRSGTLFWGTDAAEYFQIASEFVKSGSFYEYFSPAKMGELLHMRTPLYPLFLAVHFKLFGIIALYPLIIQNVLSILTGVILFLTLESVAIVPSIVSAIAALFFSLEPTGIALTNCLITETLFLFFLSIFLLSITWFLKEERMSDLIPGSLSLGLLALVRPVGVTIAISTLFFLVLFLSVKIKVNLLKSYSSLKMILLPALLFMAVIGTWQSRNLSVFGRYELSTLKGTYLATVATILVSPEANRVGFQKYREDLMTKAHQIENPFERSDWLVQQAMIPIQSIEAKIKFAKILIKNAKHIFIPNVYILDDAFFLSHFHTSRFRYFPLIAAPLSLKERVVVRLFQYALYCYYFVLWTLVLIGLVKVIRMKRVPELFLGLICLAAFAALLLPGLPNMGSRFRVPALFMLMPLFALGISEIRLIIIHRINLKLVKTL